CISNANAPEDACKGRGTWFEYTAIGLRLPNTLECCFSLPDPPIAGPAEHGCLFGKDSHSASFGQECESPLYQHEETISEPNEEIDVDPHPHKPGGES